MARTSVIFVCLSGASSGSLEAVNSIISSYFQQQKFTLVSGPERSCVESAMGIFNRFHPQAVISSQWAGRVYNVAEYISQEEANALEGWTQEVASADWQNNGQATQRRQIMKAIKSLHNDATVLCISQDTLHLCTNLLSLKFSKENLILAIVENLCSAKRHILVECCTLDEILRISVSEVLGDVSSILTEKLVQQEEALRRIFISVLPSDCRLSEIGEIAEKTRSDLSTLSEKIGASNGEVQRVVGTLGNFLQQSDREVEGAALRVREVSQRQLTLQQTAGEAVAASLRDIADLSSSLQQLEIRINQNKSDLANLQSLQPEKRKPLKVIAVWQYSESIVAVVHSYRHYTSYAHAVISSNGQVYNEDWKEIAIGEKEVFICGRRELMLGNYTLTLRNYPNKDKEISEPFSFDVTEPQGDYQGSFLYTHCSDMNAYEAELEAKGLVDALRTVAGLWINTTTDSVPYFLQAVREYAGDPTPHNLRAALVAANFMMAELV